MFSNKYSSANPSGGIDAPVSFAGAQGALKRTFLWLVG